MLSVNANKLSRQRMMFQEKTLNSSKSKKNHDPIPSMITVKFSQHICSMFRGSSLSSYCLVRGKQRVGKVWGCSKQSMNYFPW